MSLPDTKRVLYGKSPLVEVICQICFPSILRIERDISDFQEKVRKDFPFYKLKPPEKQRTANTTFTVGQDPPSDTPSHLFESADRRWKLKLSQRLLSLSTSAYGRWEEFRERLNFPVAELVKTYTPAPYHHVCLRYKNVIRRESIGEDNTPWRELITPWASGPIGNPNLSDGVQAVYNKCVVDVPGSDCSVEATLAVAIEEPSKIKVFVIEAHTYSNTATSHGDVFTRLDGINQISRRFFRNCITDRLERALMPTAI